MIPTAPEAKGKVSLSQPTPTPDNRSIFRRAGDAIMAAVSTKPTTPAPVPVPVNTQTAQQRGTTTTSKGTPSTAIPRQTPWHAPLTNPQQTGAAQTSQTGARSAASKPPAQQPSLRYSNGTVGPTPWPTPASRQTLAAPAKGPTPKPSVNATNKLAADSRTRPRVVATPTPVPQKAAKSSKPTANQMGKVKPTPKPVVKKEQPPPTPIPVPVAVTKKQFNIEVCAVSGLIPVRGLCTTRVRKSFNLGEEPTRTCSADRHR